MKELNTGNTTILAVEVPDGTSDLTYPKIGMIDLYFQTKVKSEHEEDNYISISLPDTGFEIIGIASEIKEEQAKDLVECMAKDTYRNYTMNAQYFQYCFESACASWQSFMTAHQINPNSLILKKVG